MDAYLLALARFPKFGAKRLACLLKNFSSAQAAFEASTQDLIDRGLEENVAVSFIQSRAALDPDKELADLQKHQVNIMTIFDPLYPALLKAIHDPPTILFYRGTWPAANKIWLAVVGSRQATRYGEETTEELVRPLSQNGVIIVSGLAYGIDACAHRTALANRGPTVAVLGSGVDNDSIYPSLNRTLALKIIERGGTVLSEFPIGTPALRQHFPFRNRII